MATHISDGIDWYVVSETDQQQYKAGILTLATIKATRPKKKD